MGPTTTPVPTSKLYGFEFVVPYVDVVHLILVVGLEYKMTFVQPIF